MNQSNNLTLVKGLLSLVTNKDATLDKAYRKSSASYWSNIDGARSLFKQSPLYKGWLDALNSDNSEIILAAHNQLLSQKILDPSCGGCALLIAAMVEMILMDDKLQRALGDPDPIIKVSPSQFYGIELGDVQFAEAQIISDAVDELFSKYHESITC